MSDSIKTVDIRVNPPYQVHIGGGLLARCGSYLLDAVGMCHLAVVRIPPWPLCIWTP